ncbi:C40 family peptidase [Frigoribacterium sp. CFBP9039]|uniref:C40 family peptidase n=1 Tax=Frigoribacterium sp. CFBP9029 TaxID=3096541 RepID=UPI002A6B263B|nr:C40 family peptidase [Frigoribacterium sp. CFBP9039]MDY0945630.1 C40 family peptidase [Frigoribacterium sp. CFBP9039]
MTQPVPARHENEQLKTAALRTPSDLPTRSSLRRAAAAAPAPRRRTSARRTAVSVTVMTLTAGLFGTLALPAFAQTPGATGASDVSTESAASAALTKSRTADAQTVSVADGVAAADTGRDGYTATSQATLDQAAAAAAEAVEREQERAQLAEQYASYSGPTASEYVATAGEATSSTSTSAAAAAAPAAGAATPGAFSLDAVYQTALQYLGTPYVYGGATPAGFDCSGFIMFVYAQYGISLPHSVPAQGALGTPISAAEAQPGDVIIFNDGSHDGFYAGNGMILDAPKPGGVVSVRPLWTDAVHYVRFGV